MYNTIKLFVDSWKDLHSYKADFIDSENFLDFSQSNQEIFHLILIKPTKYDDDGYAIHWFRPHMTSNSLAVVNGLVRDSIERRVLGDDVEIRVSVLDENYLAPNYEALISELKNCNQRALICLVGVQTNQFPRAYDVGYLFRQSDFPVIIGGFHVSGSIAMLDEMPPELVEAQQAGISLFAGELEGGRFDQILLDCREGKIKPLYNFIGIIPSITDAPFPCFADGMIENSMTRMGSIDLGRGCPFQCNFCCIINVQGRNSRTRSPEHLESYVRELYRRGARDLFITDDNFSRNECWNEHLDCLIRLRKEGLKLLIAIQVDTRCHEIPGFIEKAVAAGVVTVFIGMESINPANLKVMKKKQNSIEKYRAMLMAWKKHPVLVIAAYIIGLPDDTVASILQDIETIKRELPVDVLSLSIFTPLPGSELHRDLTQQGIWMDPDLNKYDLTHRVTQHPRMTNEELDYAYSEAYNRFYEFEHMKTIMKRTFGLGSNRKKGLVNLLFGVGILRKVWGVTTLDIGWKRNFQQRNRRPGKQLPKQKLFEYLGRIKRNLQFLYVCFQYIRINMTMLKLWNDPKRQEYRDEVIKEEG